MVYHRAVSTAAWARYLEALDAYRALHERLLARLPYYTGEPREEPVDLWPRELEAWHELLAEVEAAARHHREALNAYLWSREQSSRSAG